MKLRNKSGSVNDEDKWTATRLTSDHNARIPLEYLKLLKEHPGETDIVKCKNPHACYVKGRLQLTRSLGDIYLKYADFNGKENSHRSRYSMEINVIVNVKRNILLSYVYTKLTNFLPYEYYKWQIH